MLAQKRRIVIPSAANILSRTKTAGVDMMLLRPVDASQAQFDQYTGPSQVNLGLFFLHVAPRSAM
jgi:hypothetical protein